MRNPSPPGDKLRPGRVCPLRVCPAEPQVRGRSVCPPQPPRSHRRVRGARGLFARGLLVALLRKT
eukprot:12915189-Alexandrium_andersonii.AAC.1